MHNHIDRLNVKAWPFIEAYKILKRVAARQGNATAPVIFATGYGPSGLPHIGTFAEVLRTSMIRQAFQQISDLPTQLIAFSDDMDGLRKVPTNIPNQEMMQEFIGQKLSAIPDPFDKYPSFAAHNNAMLCEFLDRFGFDYQFTSATECYQSGQFDHGLLQMLKNYDKVQAVMLKSLGEERRKTYSPFLPICPKSNIVLQVAVESINPDAGTITYHHPDDGLTETEVTGGRCKLQWKPDWAMRWYVLGVDYEMAGKDLSESVKLSSQLVRILGGVAPEGISYELFLDEKGEKISKSKGNGISMQEWLRYAPEESLAYFMYGKPQTAKRLYFDIIPKQVDEYLDRAHKFPALESQAQLESPIYHLQVMGQQKPLIMPEGVSFAMLQNLTNVCHAEDKGMIWDFISRYAPDANPETMPYLDRLIDYALIYYHDFIKAHKHYLAPTGKDREALQALYDKFVALKQSGEKLTDAEQLQNLIYAVGKEYDYDPLRDWFRVLYQALLGQEQGPRMGSFFLIYGLDNSIALIKQVLDK